MYLILNMTLLTDNYCKLIFLLCETGRSHLYADIFILYQLFV